MYLVEYGKLYIGSTHSWAIIFAICSIIESIDVAFNLTNNFFLINGLIEFFRHMKLMNGRNFRLITNAYKSRQFLKDFHAFSRNISNVCMHFCCFYDWTGSLTSNHDSYTGTRITLCKIQRIISLFFDWNSLLWFP